MIRNTSNLKYYPVLFRKNLACFLKVQFATRASKWLQRRKRDKKRQTYKLQLNFRTCFVLMDYHTEMPQTSPVERGFIFLTPTTAWLVFRTCMYASRTNVIVSQVKFTHSAILLLNKSVFPMAMYCFCHCFLYPGTECIM